MSFKVVWYDSEFHQYEEVFRVVFVNNQGNLYCEDDEAHVKIIRLWVMFEQVKE